MSEWLKKHNILLRIVSVFIAILTWFFVIAEINPDMESRVKGIDVIVTDVDHLAANGLAIVDGGNEKIDIRVRGKRDKLILVEADKFTVTASAAQITVPGTYKLNCNTVVDVDGVSVISKNPSQITVVVDRVSSKTVPAEIVFTGKIPDNFKLEDYTLSPDAIVVKGPQTQLEKVSKAVIKYNLSDLSKSIETTLSYSLLDSKDVALDMTELTVDTPAIVFKANVKAVKEVPLKVDLIPDGIFAENVVNCVVKPEKIKIVGDAETLKSINQITLESVNIKKHIVSGGSELILDINVPNGVYAENAPSVAEVRITAPGYIMREIKVSTQNIQPLEGYAYISESVSVKVFGRTETINDLTQDFFTITPITSKDINDTQVEVTLIAEIKNSEVVVIGDCTAIAENKVIQ